MLLPPNSGKLFGGTGAGVIGHLEILGCLHFCGCRQYWVRLQIWGHFHFRWVLVVVVAKLSASASASQI